MHHNNFGPRQKAGSPTFSLLKIKICFPSFWRPCLCAEPSFTHSNDNQVKDNTEPLTRLLCDDRTTCATKFAIKFSWTLVQATTLNVYCICHILEVFIFSLYYNSRLNNHSYIYIFRNFSNVTVMIERLTEYFFKHVLIYP